MVLVTAKERELLYITFDETADRMAATADAVGYVVQLVERPQAWALILTLTRMGRSGYRLRPNTTIYSQR